MQHFSTIPTVEVESDCSGKHVSDTVKGLASVIPGLARTPAVQHVFTTSGGSCIYQGIMYIITLLRLHQSPVVHLHMRLLAAGRIFLQTLPTRPFSRLVVGRVGLGCET